MFEYQTPPDLSPMTPNKLIWLIFIGLAIAAVPKVPLLIIPLGIIAVVIIGSWLFSLV